MILDQKNMRRSICFFCLLIVVPLFAQYGSDDISRFKIVAEWYSDGQKKIQVGSKNKDGQFKYTEWRNNGKKKMEGYYLVLGEYTYRVGLWICWFKNGKIRSKVRYKYDYEIGECVYYNMDGSIDFKESYSYVPKVPFYESEGYFIGNVNPGNHHPEDGVWKYSGPFVTVETTYRDWKKNGPHRKWTSNNKKILLDGNYQNGKENGLWIQYRQDPIDYDNSTGIKLFETTYNNGQIDGPKREYYNSGKMKSEGYLKGVKKIGRWTFYGKDGSVLEIQDYDKSILNASQIDIQKMIDDNKDGVLFLSSGTYFIDDPIIIKNKDSFRFNTEKGTKIISRNQSAYVVKIQNSSDIVIENFFLTHFDPPESYQCEGGEILVEDSENIKIINCDLNGSGSIGVKIRKSEQIFIKNCYIYDNTYAGVFVWSSKRISIIDTNFERNGKSPKDYLLFQNSSRDDVFQKNNSIINIPLNKYN